MRMKHEQTDTVEAMAYKPPHHTLASSHWADVFRLPVLLLTIVAIACIPLLIWYTASHWDTAAQWGEVGLVCLLAVGGIRSYFFIQHKRHAQRMRDLEFAERKADIDFKRTQRLFLENAMQREATVKVFETGAFEVIPLVPLPQPQSRITSVTEEQASQKALPPPPLVAPGLRQPSQRSLLDQLEENALQVSPGIRTSDGTPVILSIPDAVHFKLIGSSGFGKSCLAAALLDQAIRLNSPDLLQVALLDLEHKTSRLFENAPNVATFQVGRRSVPMVATNADEVAVHLGYLKRELDRRAQLSEYELQSEPLLLIYVEEMLSLQYEVDEKLLVQMLKDLSVLAVRARKYNMFLLACAQTDYSTPELKTAQKQFRSRIAFAVDTTAARAAGFMSTELIKYSFAHSQKGDGMYVLETPGVASLMLAPVYNVKQKVLALEARSSPVQDVFTGGSLRIVNSERTHLNTDQQPVQRVQVQREQPQNDRLAEIQKLQAMGWGKIAIVERLWNVKRGGSLAWKQAVAEYETLMMEEREA